jgi:hypothetical protein
MQVSIALTGNYCFFNLLTIALCLPLIDDLYWERKGVVGRDATWPAEGKSSATLLRALRVTAAMVALALLLPLNGMLIISAFQPRVPWPKAIGAIYDILEPFRIVNGYGLFRVMTKNRPEIIVEGSADGVEWRPYEFKWKPGETDRAPGWVAPHQPRLDWQMWFAALSSYRHNPWFVQFVERLLRNEPVVTKLLARNPFPIEPPRYVRATLYQYHFTTISERRETGAWWKREKEGEYLPMVSLQQFE